MNFEEEIVVKINEYKADLDIDEMLNMEMDWYDKARIRAISELNNIIVTARKEIVVKDYTITINSEVKKGHFQNNMQNHLSGELYFENNKLIDFGSEYLKVLPREVIEGIVNLNYNAGKYTM